MTCIGIPKHWRLSSFRYETFYYFLDFYVFDTRRERVTRFLLCWLFVQRQLSIHWPNIRTCIPQQTTGLASPRFVSQLASSSLKSQLTAFFKIPKNPSPSLPGMTSFTSRVPFPLRVFFLHLWLSHPPRARRNTCAQCVPLPVQ